jgi:hypothetical protein
MEDVSRLQPHHDPISPQRFSRTSTHPGGLAESALRMLNEQRREQRPVQTTIKVYLPNAVLESTLMLPSQLLAQTGENMKPPVFSTTLTSSMGVTRQTVPACVPFHGKDMVDHLFPLGGRIRAKS